MEIALIHMFIDVLAKDNVKKKYHIGLVWIFIN